MIGALTCGTGVAFGAFGAHGLKQIVSADMLVIFETGVRYQVIHGLATLVLAALTQVLPERKLNIVANLFLAGTIIFSGSLYALALTSQRMLGAITPIGGVCYLLGWVMLAIRNRA